MTELEAWQQLYPEVRARGALLIAISPQLVRQNDFAVQHHHLTFPILTDPGAALAQQFGVAYPVPEPIQAHYRSIMINIPFMHGDQAEHTWRLPLPATFILRQDNTLAFAEAHADHRVRPDPKTSSPTFPNRSTPPHFVISTEAQRSGETCRFLRATKTNPQQPSPASLPLRHHPTTMNRRDFNKLLATAATASAANAFAAIKPTTPETLHFARNGWVPNHPTLPVLLYHQAFDPNTPDLASVMERTFEQNGWPPQWRNGVYDFHHFHSTAHEVLGFAAGSAHLILGGPVVEDAAPNQPTGR